MKDVRHAVRTGGKIRRNGCSGKRAAGTGKDVKTRRESAGDKRLYLNITYPRSYRRGTAQTADKFCNTFSSAAKLDVYTPGIIGHRALQTQFFAQPKDKGTEPHSLNNTLYPDCTIFRNAARARHISLISQGGGAAKGGEKERFQSHIKTLSVLALKNARMTYLHVRRARVTFPFAP